MAFTFQPVRLDIDYGDSACMLVFRDDRLAAILTCLGAEHDEAAGSWYIEASFSDVVTGPQRSFASLAEFGDWARLPAPQRQSAPAASE